MFVAVVPSVLVVYVLIAQVASESAAGSGADSDQVLHVAAFNVQVFGKKKFSKENVVAILSEIVRRYDIILIQEIRDSSETVIRSFLDIINSESPAGAQYGMSVSQRLGRTRSKEQYAYLYRTDKIEEPQVYQYDDPGDVFEREPYCILLKPKDVGCPNFFLVGIHTKPSDVYKELNLLDDVFEQASLEFGTRSGIILGDFNAGCSYLPYSKYESLDLVTSTDPKYNWLIDVNTDTTVSASDCAYDRIVTSGEITNYIPRESAAVFRFDEEFGLSKDETKSVSDHFPVELVIGGEYIVEEKVFECDLEAIGQGLKVATFNVRIFGATKFKKMDVVRTLSKIIRHYDVIFIQEIRDSKETVIYSFLDVVNSDSLSGEEYGITVSKRLGRTRSKEQYAFIYRTDKVKVINVYQDEDTDDVFEREPYCVLLQSNQTGVPDFFLVGIHVKPSDVLEELNQLDDVFEQASLAFGTSNGVILGNFNADCSYLSSSEYEQLDLVTDSNYTWLIDTTADTTVSGSNCAYDRIVVSGEIMDYIPLQSAQVFQFDEEFDLPHEEAKHVSDHYPVEFQLFEKKQLDLCKYQQQQQLQKDIKPKDELSPESS